MPKSSAIHYFTSRNELSCLKNYRNDGSKGKSLKNCRPRIPLEWKVRLARSLPRYISKNIIEIKQAREKFLKMVTG